MAKHKVSELEGALLDAAVAKAEGLKCQVNPPGHMKAGCSLPDDHDSWRETLGGSDPYLNFSTQWSLGGAIVDRELISVIREWSRDDWCAGMNVEVGQCCRIDHEMSGPTPLIAAMRAYVASKFGEEIDL